ncbi:hypothetical protein ROS62_20970 [Streptomyces sp. DSM 41972]|uniref:Integral membrane protein n=1 Tax=Streptomyces althioticus subsp. attaecolombicae TaxID=3075534 RepID=A0ABU3I2S1_9ACTN|nr:hypothetical protein [Streptomyces sp. DSM 41972]SCD58621.1 hypothetical protein GA0115238_116414 [Streptomyces sp. di50b]SCE24113.1 hypothetical protein GA0115245_127013 [Streptomyces sp. di188]
MTEPAHPSPQPDAPRTAERRAPETRLVSGVYGLVLASALAAALDSPDEQTSPGSDALWVLLTALAAAAAHGYAHVLSHRMSGEPGGTRAGLRAMFAQWPLVAAAAPTIVLLLFAVPDWWTEASAVEVALVLNTLILAGWGMWTARRAGRTWPASLRAGAADMLIGLVIIGANAVIK